MLNIQPDEETIALLEEVVIAHFLCISSFVVLCIGRRVHLEDFYMHVGTTRMYTHADFAVYVRS